MVFIHDWPAMDKKDFTKVAIWPTLPDVTFIVVIFITVNIDLVLWTLKISFSPVSHPYYTIHLFLLHAIACCNDVPFSSLTGCYYGEADKVCEIWSWQLSTNKTRHHSQSLPPIFTIYPPSQPLNVHLNFVRLKHTANNTNWKNLKCSMIHN